ncbi:MAG TPA: AAA family ATPase [Dehalococcoidia bacterium]|nr:AAA family ATPase [Dehalococcoidia bacterium]MDP7214300.1 AAA family ATPase [Dehalococcoidia bacterium]MDP7514193.1 AAA family ATPase [Dehalococcoidia bacterium]HJM53988.1 AAA family ATPase [Dehalococcoidia bacterium]
MAELEIDTLTSEPKEQRITDDLQSLISPLPERIQGALDKHPRSSELLEVVMDLGRTPEARFPDETLRLSDLDVTDADLQWVVERIGEFGDDNRAGIERTLHRISVIRNRGGRPVGVTCRVGRAVFGTGQIIDDLVRTGQSILLLGRPGVGKTTILREVARVLADEVGKRVVIVDTSNEIAGDGDVPHPAIGRARRMQVPSTPQQHQVMIEAVENHMPEVVIIDEMSTEAEAMAARTIAERGVQLIATAHGNTLANLISNPTLSDLVGGTQTVTLGDNEARRRRTQKTVLERKHRPTFEVVVEIQAFERVGVHADVGSVVDTMLRGYLVEPEVRAIENDEVQVIQDASRLGSSVSNVPQDGPRLRAGLLSLDNRDSGRDPGRSRGDVPASRPVREPEPEPEAPRVTSVYVFGVPRTNLQEAVNRLNAPVDVVDTPEEADMFLTTKSHYSRRPTAVREAEAQGLPVYVLRKGSGEQIKQFVERFEPKKRSEAPGRRTSNVVRSALTEAEVASQEVLAGEDRIDLDPQPAFIRRLQHGVGGRYNIGSSSTGQDPYRHVVLRRRRR